MYLINFANQKTNQQSIKGENRLYSVALHIVAFAFFIGFLWFISQAIFNSSDREAVATVAAAFAAAFAGIIGILIQANDRRYHLEAEKLRIQEVARMIYVELVQNIQSLEKAFQKHAKDHSLNAINEIPKADLPLIDVRTRRAFIRDIAEMESILIASITESTHSSEVFNLAFEKWPDVDGYNRPNKFYKLNLVIDVYLKTTEACDNLSKKYSFDKVQTKYSA